MVGTVGSAGNVGVGGAVGKIERHEEEKRMVEKTDWVDGETKVVVARMSSGWRENCRAVVVVVVVVVAKRRVEESE